MTLFEIPDFCLNINCILKNYGLSKPPECCQKENEGERTDYYEYKSVKEERRAYYQNRDGKQIRYHRRERERREEVRE